MGRERLRIVVTGLAATYPYGGVFWDYLSYALGLRRLGHDVLYLEDTGRWCYRPEEATFTADGGRNAASLAAAVAAVDPDLAWFFRDATGRCHGSTWEQVARFCRDADLFLHLSGCCWMREEYFAARRVVLVDTDPGYTQASVPAYLKGTADAAARARVDELREHDVFFTFAENIGAPDCSVPTGLFDWVPTRQPVVRELLARAAVPAGDRSPRFTTVGSWDAGGAGGKRSELLRFAALPGRVPVALHLALSGDVPAAWPRRSGWILDDATAVSDGPWRYLAYLARSLGEWSVAKRAYVTSRSGWFSCRSACYLALGVPVVVQDTGFGCAIPTGEGVLAFDTLDEAAAAVERVAAEPRRHAAAAGALAAEFFDSDRVLTRLLDRALGT